MSVSDLTRENPLFSSALLFSVSPDLFPNWYKNYSKIYLNFHSQKKKKQRKFLPTHRGILENENKYDLLS